MRAGRILRVVATLACGGLIAAACSSGTPSTTTTTTTTTGHRTTTTTGVTPTTAGTTTTTGIAPCTQVSVTPGQTQGAAGTIIGTITLAAVGTAQLHDRGLPEPHALQRERRRRAHQRGAGIDHASRGAAVAAAGAGHACRPASRPSSPSSTPMSSPARRRVAPSRRPCRSPRRGRRARRHRCRSPSRPVTTAPSTCRRSTPPPPADRRVHRGGHRLSRRSLRAVALAARRRRRPPRERSRWPTSAPTGPLCTGSSRVPVTAVGSSSCAADDRRGGRSLRTRCEYPQPCHEYGGGACCLVPKLAPGAFAYVEASDQRVWLQRGPGEPARALTPVPPEGERWAHGGLGASADGAWVVAVREVHVCRRSQRHPGAPWSRWAPAENGGGESILAEGHDFYGAPRLDATTQRLAVVAWDHPDMSWDRSAVIVIPLAVTADTTTGCVSARSRPANRGRSRPVRTCRWDSRSGSATAGCASSRIVTDGGSPLRTAGGRTAAPPSRPRRRPQSSTAPTGPWASARWPSSPTAAWWPG